MSTKIWATISDQLAKRLEERADREGRSKSDLVAYLLERQMEEWKPPKKDN